MIKNHFKAYNKLTDDIYVKNMQLQKLKEDWYTITGTSYDKERIKGGQRYDIADQLHNIIQKEKELKAIISYKEELRRVHENEINKIKDSKKRTILKLFYLDRCSIKQIAYCLRISESHAKKLKRGAINEFKEIIV